MHLENMQADQIADHTSNHHIGRKVFAAAKSRNRNCCGCAINQPFHPRPRVFAGNHTCHGPSEERMPGRKRAVEGIIAPEKSVAVALNWTLPAESQRAAAAAEVP